MQAIPEKRPRLEPLQPRVFRKIPIFIVEYHNDVLEFIYRCFGSRHLSLKDNVFVHVDSHPDMVISRNIPTSRLRDKEFLLEKLAIENWIIPTLYVSHFTRLIWLKNSWCKQFPTGKVKLRLCEHHEVIYANIPNDYYTSEGNYCEQLHPGPIREIDFEVYNVDTGMESLNLQDYVLDIDLDFFSTRNPFLTFYEKVDCYHRLGKIFHYDSSKASLAASLDRQRQLDELESAFYHADKNPNFDNFENTELSPEIYNELKSLVFDIKQNYTEDEIDWFMIFEAGCTTGGLPHNESTPEELEIYYNMFKEAIRKFPKPPTIITMARSSKDDYCPDTQVDEIQDRVLELLHEVFPGLIHSNPIRQYLDEKWDVMNL